MGRFCFRCQKKHFSDKLLAQCLKLAARRNCRTVIGVYCPTANNGQVRDFYASHGFNPRNDGGEFLVDLSSGKQIEEPTVFKRIDSEFESVEVR